MKITKERFLEVLDTLRAAVAADDSFEGRLSYSLMEEGLERGEVEVEAFFRVGNSQGQGGSVYLPGKDQ